MQDSPSLPGMSQQVTDERVHPLRDSHFAERGHFKLLVHNCRIDGRQADIQRVAKARDAVGGFFC